MSDDVTQFLQQVQQMQGRRAEEDEAKSRELEEKILQEKSERAARRAERARSISPQKSSPANTPPPPSHRGSRTADRLSQTTSPALESPMSRRDAPADTMGPRLDNLSTTPTRKDNSSQDPESKWASGTSPSLPSPGSRPLSWQRRPRPLSPEKQMARPLSMMAAHNAARTSSAASPEATDESLSKDRIAQTLSGKDPAWFRQTPDRGLSSPAYRREQVEDGDRSDVSLGRSQLPGMTPSSRVESPASVPLPLRRSKTGSSALDLTSSPRLDPPADYESRTLERSPTRADGRMSPNRPLSPTKGMGGFVQSAMMKRSDSVKRWSVASPPGLARADSVASNRSGLRDRANTTSQANSRSRPASMIRDSGSTTPTLRRHGSEETGGGIEPPTVGSQAVADHAPDTRANLRIATPPAQEDEKATPPASPSKTMDARRWSPTKSSWLEAALNKPESPKPKPVTPQSNQPAWMVELNKAKAQRANNPEATSKPEPPSHKHEVKIGGLMRPIPATISKASTTAGLGPPFSPVTSSSDRGATAGLRSPSINPTSTDLAASGPPANERGRQSSVVSIEGKVNPELPTKLDFRGNLKPRQPPGADAQKGSVNELSAVFGNLRKTKTQNYVAPDELKSNVLRGKAALNTTGGPVKTERKDEFKEAILKKKTEFKQAQAEGTGVSRSSNVPVETPIPEGIARRNELGRSPMPSSRDSVFSDTTRAASSAPSNRDSMATDTTGTESASPSPAFKPAETPATVTMFEDTPAQPATTVKSPMPSLAAAPKDLGAQSRAAGRVGGSLADRFNPALAGMLARGPPAANPSKPAESSAQSPAAGPSSASGGPQLSHITKNRARGPRRKAPSSASRASATNSSTPQASQPEPSPKPASSNQAKPADLSTMASPATAMAEPPIREQVADSSKATPVDQLRLVDSSRMSPSYNQTYSYSRRKENNDGASTSPDQIKLVDSSAMREAYAAATPTRESRGSVSSISHAGNTLMREARGSYSGLSAHKGSIASQVAASASQRSSPFMQKATDEKKEAANEEAEARPSSPKKPVLNRVSRFLDDAQPSPKSVPEKEPIRPQSRSQSPAKASEQAPEATESPRPLSKPLPPSPQVKPDSATRALPQLPSPTKDVLEKPSSVPSSVRNVATMFDSGAPLPPTKDSGIASSTSERSRSRSPTKAGNQALSLGPITPSRVQSPMRSPTRQTVEVSQLLDDFFGAQRPKREYRVDTADILMNRPATAQEIKTHSVQRLQIFGDGKMVQIPAHNDRVLFEREMYVCSHTFTGQSGRRTTEVYLWVGDEVPAMTARGAEAFAAREARSLGGGLSVLRQGKETPEFLMALGGIVITRRGSSNKYDSLAPNMLCGRRYLGCCVAFDEVDFSPASLCSGFPYLITQQGRCFLWKGRGSDGDELDSARLVGMDLSLTGRLEEVEDGSEPVGFWDVFEGQEKGPSADHWRLKPSYGKYSCRLFCSEAENKQQITEISPYAQSDLSPQKIYVLDAFFEMYIVVGAESTTQYPSFRNALDFAQEYAILASGMEDRPFVPISTVVLEGIPRDLKSVFRKWREGRGPTRTVGEGGGGQGARGLSRGRSLRIVPLTHALQALAE